MRLRALILLALIAAGWSEAQSVVASRTGRINAAEGDVFLDGQPIFIDPVTPLIAEPGSDLVTRTGRAEIQLGPQAWLRVAQYSAVRMISDDLGDVRVELLEGSVIVNARTPVPLTLVFGEQAFRTERPVSYRLDASPAQIRFGNGPIYSLAGAVMERPVEAPDRLFDLWAGERDILTNNQFIGLGSGQPLLDTGVRISSGYAPLLSPEPPYVVNYGKAYHGLDSGVFGFIAPFGVPLQSYVPTYQVPRVYPIYPGYLRQPGAIGPGIMYPPGTIPTLRGPGIPRGAGRR